ncbi:E3 ubiquitin-protein ligase RNF166-like [Watersipora subatra]|uniref:E3 ubiquitin-protein ligase RNF166-like n=1 Tax=Watersipora subatra TaxID=2589382 RepID=UPI00355B833B
MNSSMTRETAAGDASSCEFMCSICKDYLKEPVKTSCNHVFCKVCLLTSLNVSLNCPCCRTQVLHYEVAEAMEESMISTLLTCDRCQGQFRAVDGRDHDDVCVDAYVSRPVARNPDVVTGSNTHLFSCAYCGARNFSREGLLAHCNANHKHAPSHKLVCTICVAYPWGESDKTSIHLLRHMNLRHQFDYDWFVNLEEDEEDSLQAALEASIAENTIHA